MKNRQAEDPPRAIETARVPIEVVHDPDRAAEITAALRAGELRELAKLGWTQTIRSSSDRRR